MSTRRSRNLRLSLVAAIVCFGLAIAFYVLLPQAPGAVNTSHTSIYPTPGAVTLPPTAPPVATTPGSR